MLNKFVSRITENFCNLFYYYYPNTRGLLRTSIIYFIITIRTLHHLISLDFTRIPGSPDTERNGTDDDDSIQRRWQTNPSLTPPFRRSEMIEFLPDRPRASPRTGSDMQIKQNKLACSYRTVPTRVARKTKMRSAFSYGPCTDVYLFTYCIIYAWKILLWKTI